MKKIIISIVLIIISSYLNSSVLPETGIIGLIGGVNIRNSAQLFLSEFIIAASLFINNFGRCEKYIHDYGKYKLLRHKKRSFIMLHIYVQTFIYILFVVIMRVFSYSAILIVENKKISIEVKSILIYISLCLMIYMFLSILQYSIELKYSSFAGLTISMIYYILSVSLGGVLIENEMYLPILMLVPNYNMKNRTDIILNELDFSVMTLYFILAFSIVGIMVLNNNIIKKKDIF